MRPVISIEWTTDGNLRVEDVVTEQAIMTIKFHGEQKSPQQKLEFVREVLELAMNSVELNQ